jgi:dTDP-4-dehydrorhamnose reductase
MKKSKKEKKTNEDLGKKSTILRTSIVVKHIPKELNEDMIRELIEVAVGKEGKDIFQEKIKYSKEVR